MASYDARMADEYAAEQTLGWPMRSFFTSDSQDIPLRDLESDYESINRSSREGNVKQRIPRKPVGSAISTLRPKSRSGFYAPLSDNYEEELPQRSASTFWHDPVHDGAVSSIELRKTSDAKQWRERKQSTISQQPQFDKSGHQGSGRHIRYWNPFWLSRIFLISFAALLAVFAVLLIALWRISQNENGFPLVTENHYYYSHYSRITAIAILVVVVSLWRQVDYWAKFLTPWQELKNGEASAERSVLLDYVFPLQAITFWRALRNSHLVVALSVLVFVLLKIVTIISAGLFILRSIEMPAIQGLLVTKTKFNASNFADLLNGSTSPILGQGNTPLQLSFEAYAYLTAGLAYPEGLTADAVYETLAVAQNSDKTQNITFSAEVRAFYADFNCEPAKVTLTLPSYNTTLLEDSVPIYATSASCTAMEVVNMDLDDPRSGILPPRMLFSGTDITDNTVNCTDGAWKGKRPVLQQIVDVRYTQTWADAPGTNLTHWSIDVVHVTGIMCHPRYSIDRANITYDRTSSEEAIRVNKPRTTSGDQLSGMTGADLYEAVLLTLTSVDSAFASDLNGILGFGADALNVEDTALLDISKLLEAATTAFKGVSNRLIQRFVSQPTNNTIAGTVIYQENRIFLANAPLWAMVGIFTVLIVAVLVVLYNRPSDVVPSNVEIISRHALILARSLDMQSLLLNTGRFNTDELEERLMGHQFRSELGSLDRNTSAFLITSSDPTIKQASSIDVSDPKLSWWHPLASHWILRIITLGLPIIVIAVLEGLQMMNDKNNGVASISNANGIAAQIWTRILPAFVMVVVATAFNSLDFTLMVQAPFFSMKKGQQSAERGIESSALGKTPPVALYLSIKNRHLAAAFSIFAALLGSVLSIISSSLYTVADTSSAQPLQVQRMDAFDPTWENSLNDDSRAALLSSLIETSTIPYPAFTYGEIAIPQIGLSKTAANLTAELGNQEALLSITLPVLRASLGCNISSDANKNVTGDYSFYEFAQVNINAETRIDLPPNCHKGGIGGNLSYIDWSWESATGGNASYLGELLDLHTGPWNQSYEDGVGEESSVNYYSTNAPGCPSLGFAFGHYDLSNKTGKLASQQSDVTMMTCYQLMQEIEATVTFTVPDLQIASAQPPVVHESTARYLESSPNGEIAFEYRPQLHLDNSLFIFSNSKYASIEPIVDTFYQAVLFGQTPTNESSLTGKANQEHLFNATQAFYRRYMAQAISRNMRVTISNNNNASASEATSSLLTGTYYNPLHPRIFQNNSSKLALQIILGVMVLCGILAYYFSDMSHTLPHNPCSIAGTMSLLAGSEMCSGTEKLPEGAEWMTEKELAQNGVWDGWLFSLGWWPGREGEEKRFGIDVGRAMKA